MSDINSNNIREIRLITRSLRRIAGPARVEVMRVLGQTAIAQASLGVRTGTDPYRKRWAPLTSRIGQPLRATGNNIQRGWTARVLSADAFVFGSRFKYLRTHQYGATIVPRFKKALFFPVFGENAYFVFARKVVIPRRQMVPEADTGGMGSRWMGAFSRTIAKWMAKNMPAKIS